MQLDYDLNAVAVTSITVDRALTPITTTTKKQR
jgi:hypothetical protein